MDLRSIIEIVVARVYHTTNLHHSSLRRGYMVVSRQSEPTRKITSQTPLYAMVR